MDLMEVKDRVKELPIQDVLYDELQWVGKKPLCPFHDDRRPGSFVLNKRKNWWTCYSCGKGGDAIHFFEEKYGMTFVEAVSHIAVSNGIVSKSEMEEILKSCIGHCIFAFLIGLLVGLIFLSISKIRASFAKRELKLQVKELKNQILIIYLF